MGIRVWVPEHTRDGKKVKGHYKESKRSGNASATATRNIEPPQQDPLVDGPWNEDELSAVLKDERHLGWGYATSRHHDPDEKQALDDAVLRQANKLDLSKEDMFVWANSKQGRWLVDHSTSLRPDDGRAAYDELVADYLNRDNIDALYQEE